MQKIPFWNPWDVTKNVIQNILTIFWNKERRGIPDLGLYIIGVCNSEWWYALKKEKDEGEILQNSKV